MGKYQIVKTPDGRYQIFSTVSDSFLFEAPVGRNPLLRWLKEEAHKEVDRQVENEVQRVDSGNKPYYQFTLTWEECVKLDRRTRKAAEKS